MAKYIKIIFLAITLPYVFLVSLYPQQVPRVYFLAKNIQFENVTIQAEYAESDINCIFQDQEGFLWFGTRSGLWRYDGYDFKIFRHDPKNSKSLSNNIVWTIAQSRSGHLWIGTDNGLNRFDPVTETFKRHLYTTDKSFSTIRSICEDRSGVLWVGTFDGLYRLSKSASGGNPLKKEEETFIRYRHNPDNPNSLSHDYISVIYEDRQGNLWIGTGDFTSPTLGGGLNQMIRSRYPGVNTSAAEDFSVSFRHYRHGPADPASLSNDWVTAILQDRSGALWVATDRGLNKFDRVSGKFTRYLHKKNDPSTINSNWLKTLCEDQNGNLWIGSYLGGLDRLDGRTGGITRFLNPTWNADKLDQTTVKFLYKDHSGMIWAATWGEGIYKFNPSRSSFSKLELYERDQGVVKDYNVQCLFQDSDSILWIGTLGTGIAYNQRTLQVTLWPNTSYHCFAEDNSGKIWVGTGDGLLRYDKISKHWDTLTKENANLSSNDIHELYLDRENILWFTTGNGLNKSNLNRIEGGKITREAIAQYPVDPQDSTRTGSWWGSAIYEDRSGFLWIGTGNGLYRFDRSSGIFKSFKFDRNQTLDITLNSILSVYEDSSANIWVGSAGGLIRMSPEEIKQNSFTVFTMEEGLPNNVINSILSDEHGNLWLGTNNGLSRFDPRTVTFKNYDASDGLPGNRFKWRAAFKNGRGETFFGSTKGVCRFHPDSIKVDRTLPPVILTQFRKFDREVLLDTALSYIKTITLPYKENMISFKFAALDYTNPQKNQYAYKLEGFNDHWIYTDNKREASYTNLDPGVYTFRVKASNHDGIWNEEGSSIRIVITPPWWRSNWAYAVYIVLIGMVVLGWRRFELNQVRLKNELKMKEFEAQKLQEIDHLKSRFFANISHEFRTPLTLILGGIHKLITRSDTQIFQSDFEVMQRNASRLLQLINQLLDLAKLEAGGMKLEASRGDMGRFLRQVFASFASMGEAKGIQLLFNNAPIIAEAGFPAIYVYFDGDKLEKVFYNLFSNAFKFTPREGRIDVTVSVGNQKDSGFGSQRDYPGKNTYRPSGIASRPAFSGVKPVKIFNSEIVEIRISNTGPGIPAEKLPFIFDRFYQVDDATTRQYEGTGIGLALVKELVDLHRGEVTVESAEAEETAFIVRLPLGKLHLKNEEITEEAEEPIDIPDLEAQTPEATTVSPEEEPVNGISDKTLILVIEDHSDLRKFIREQLIPEYAVIEAENGEAGLQKAAELIPDLVISDIMMPEMDGYELCRRLKTSPKTNHIPVILLTARAAPEDKLEGLETGADDYLVKPFNPEELKIRVRNLIRLRQQMREKFSAEMLLKPSDVTVPSTQKVFLERLRTVIEEHLDDEDFSVEKLGQEMGMSRAQIHRKLRAITNQSASEFIRSFRLQRAAELIKQDAGNIAEIAYMVGFNSQAYFTRCFQEMFGCSPREYKRKTQER